MAAKDESSLKPVADPENPPFSVEQNNMPLKAVCQGRLALSTHRLEFADSYNRVQHLRLR
jgi:hypothetical protein